MRWSGRSIMRILSSWPRRSVACALVLVVVAMAAATPATPAGEVGVYRTVPASADGIGKQYLGREIAQVMGYDGAPWLDRPTRDREERTDSLVES